MLSPSLFAILSGISLVGAGMLFVMGKYGGPEIRMQSAKLSDLEPSEYRVAAYLALVSGWGVAGLVLTLIAGLAGGDSVCGVVLIVLASLCFVVLLCFLYAAGCTLLHTLVGKTDGPVAWFFPATRHFDSQIVRFGDFLLSGIYAKPSRESVMTRAGGLPRAIARSRGGARHGQGPLDPAEAIARIEGILAEYEAGLSSEQKAKLATLRGIVQDLGDMHP
jgi:hypothetical protein